MRWVASAGVVLLVASSCGDVGESAAPSETTVPTATTTATTQSPTVSSTTTIAVPISTDSSPWGSTPLAADEVPETLKAQWEQSDVKGFCSALFPSTPLPEDATIRAANFSGGWAVAWDMPDGPGRFGSGEYCEDCGRGAFGIAGAFGPADGDETEVWDQQLQWPDGSKAGFGFEGLGDGSQGEPHLMYLLVKGEGCLYNMWSFLGEDHLLGLLDSLRFAEELRGEPTLWGNERPLPEVVELGTPAWVSEAPLTEADISDLYILEWEGEAQGPASCPMLAYADLGAEATDATIRRANSEGEMLLAWDRPTGPGHDASSDACSDCGRGVVGLGTFLGGQRGDEPITHRWSDGSEAAAFDGFYGTEVFLQPDGFSCTYWMWSHLGPDHVDYLLTQLRRVEGNP
ncbi:MAG: hypothetical protein OES13_08540 [Acidimicrobiia bacterium]|nr:hypothetical protein [Acidimicrobiia bacterium]